MIRTIQDVIALLLIFAFVGGFGLILFATLDPRETSGVPIEGHSETEEGN